jgi:hypothetical protein
MPLAIEVGSNFLGKTVNPVNQIISSGEKNIENNNINYFFS